MSSAIEELPETSHAWRRLQLSRAKLKTSTRNSALLAGFAMVAMVELQLDDSEDNPIPLGLLIFFGVTTTLLVSVHLLALMISSCILPHIDAIALSDERDIESINDSPHEKMHFFIEISWIFSNVIGICLFLIEIAALCWVKFWELGEPKGEPGKKTAIAATVVLFVVILFFLFYAFYFYRQLLTHNVERNSVRIQELETMASRLGARKKFSIWSSSGIWRNPRKAPPPVEITTIRVIEVPTARARAS